MLIVVMAGGKSLRMGFEKPLALIRGKPMLLWVYEKAIEVGDTVVAVSRNAPKTVEFCKGQGIETIETPGKGYVEDVRFILREYGEFVSVACDIPFIRAEDIRAILENFRGVSLTGVLNPKNVPKFVDLNRLPIYKGWVIVGLNAVSWNGEEFFELDNPLLALNVNTPEDLALANVIALNLDVYRVSDFDSRIN